MPSQRTLASVLFAVTAFASSFLLFLIEPVIAKALLPLFGGSASVWVVSLLFFQIALLAGYGYAHWLGIRPIGMQRALHGTLLLVSLAWLPIQVRGTPVSFFPSLGVLSALLATIGIPFILLSSHMPLLQRWESGLGVSKNTYRLAIPSNIASFAALLTYPFLLEPRVGLHAILRAWSIGFGILVLLLAGCAWLAKPKPIHEAMVEHSPERQVVSWIGLAFLPAALLTAVTLFLTTQVAPLPLLWTLPLALYLITLIVAFAWPSLPWDKLTHRFLPWLLLAWGVGWLAPGIPNVGAIAIHLAGFTGLAMACHARLVSRRPEARGLTRFYLAMAAGGALGGAFSAIAAPILFKGLLEYPLLILLSVATLATPTRKRRTLLNIGTVVSVLVAVAVLVAGLQLTGWNPKAAWLIASVLAVALVRRWDAVWGAIAAAPVMMAFYTKVPIDRIVFADRSFYGVHRVYVNRSQSAHWLSNGTTLHGAQWLDPKRRHSPIAYYDPTGPLGDIFRGLPPKKAGRRVGVIGLGAGAMAAYADPNDRWTFFELDSAVIDIAHNDRLFTFLKDAKTSMSVVPGDARKSLASVPDHQLDLLIVDAFGSDWIPSHLLTREAMGLYLDKLAEGGWIVLHLSNQFVELWPVIAGHAQDRQLAVLRRQRVQTPESLNQGILGSRWAVLTKDEASLATLGRLDGWHRPRTFNDARLWTDDLASVVGLLRW